MKKIVKRFLYVFYSIYCLLFCNRKYKILNENDTIDKILEGKYSVSRFGDGEFKWILGVKQNSFQTQSEELSKELLETFMNNNPKCLIGIPRAINNTKEYNFEAKFYWKRFKFKYYKKLEKIIDINKIYIDASFTRPYIDFINKDNMDKKFGKIKKLWSKRKILIVEGQGVNFGVGNNLLDNAKSIERIICPSKDAFNCIDEIYSEIIKQFKGHLVLIALGPTASILCDKLSKNDIQSIDIGHLDVEYCWYLNGCNTKTNIIGKNVNEKNKDESVNMYIDKKQMKKEIISYIGVKKGIGDKCE